MAAPADAKTQQAPLDELMLAMDVVDTLRHRDLVVARELGAEERDAALKQRLREIYASQGIEVSDEVLAAGVRALHENRFVYAAPDGGFARTLAHVYVTRSRWGGLATAVVAVLAAVGLGYQLLVRGPEQRAIAALPADLAAIEQKIDAVTDDAAALRDAQALGSDGEAALARGDLAAARAALAELERLDARLERQYELRIVSRPGERSGVWRVPEDNPSARNYYLIVEAIGPDGEALTLPITSEETGRVERVSQWGLRVDEATYERVARDKQDDGIIQQDVVGVKRRGELEADYALPTSGGAITRW